MTPAERKSLGTPRPLSKAWFSASRTAPTTNPFKANRPRRLPKCARGEQTVHTGLPVRKEIPVVIEKHKCRVTAQGCTFEIAMLNQAQPKIGQVKNRKMLSPAFPAQRTDLRNAHADPSALWIARWSAFPTARRENCSRLHSPAPHGHEASATPLYESFKEASCIIAGTRHALLRPLSISPPPRPSPRKAVASANDCGLRRLAGQIMTVPVLVRPRRFAGLWIQ
jgi:hypothetical protein